MVRSPVLLVAAIAALLLVGCCNPCPCERICDPCASCPSMQVHAAPRAPVVVRTAPSPVPTVVQVGPAPAAPAAPTAPAAPKAVPYNATCPVMLGNPVNPDITTVWNGKVVGFCSETCRVRFTKDPEKYAKNLP